MSLKTKWDVTGRFYLDVHRIVSAKTKAEAERKCRDFALNSMKLKKKHWAKDEANAINLGW